MNKTLQILLFLCFAAIRLSAADNYPVGARSIALSNAFISVTDPWSTFHNQATLSNLSNFSAGVFYESKYLVDELSLAAGTIILPALEGTLGFSFYQLGEGTFKENKIGLAYSKRLSEKLNAAVQFDYFSYRFPENEKEPWFSNIRSRNYISGYPGVKFRLPRFQPNKKWRKNLLWQRKSGSEIQIGRPLQIFGYGFTCIRN